MAKRSGIDDIDVLIQKTGINTQGNNVSTPNNNPNSSNQSNSNTGQNNRYGSSTVLSGSNQSGGSNNSGNNTSQSGYGSDNTSQSNIYTRKTQQQDEIEVKREAIIDNYNRQTNAVKQIGSSVSDALGSIADAYSKKMAEEDARDDAERQARRDERNEEREKQKAEEAEEEKRQERKEREEEQRRIEDQKREDELEEALARKTAIENAKIKTNTSLWSAKSKTVLPNSLINFSRAKKTIEITDPTLTSVFYIIWNFSNDGQIVISNPIEIKKSPDGDWPITSDLYSKIETDSRLVINQTPDNIATDDNTLGYLLGYFKSKANAQSALDNLKANAIKNGYTVKYQSTAFSDNLQHNDIPKTKSQPQPNPKDFWKE